MHMIKWIIINGIALHVIMSAVWVQGFMWCMTAFDGGEYVAIGEATFVLHSSFYFPIVITEYLGLPITPDGLLGDETLWEAFKSGPVGPHPCIATMVWCFGVGALIWWGLHRWRAKKRSAKSQPA